MKKERKIGVFGGTFNPIHNGHIKLAETYYKALDLDEVIVIPTAIPPHKAVNNEVSSQDRLEMVKLAFEGYPYVNVSDIEILAGGKSYTILTLKKLKELNPNSKFFLIIGGDMFLCFEEWKQYRDILSICTVCTAPREEGELLKLLEYQKRIDPQKQCTIVLDIPVLEVSSTEIRTKIENKQQLKSLVPVKVFEYIVKKGLYNND